MKLLSQVLLLAVFVFSANSSGLTMDTVQWAAEKRGLPTELFEDIKDYDPGSIDIIGENIDLPKYYVFWNDISLPQAQFKKFPTLWTAMDWNNFYNELFHAWWDVVFEESYFYRDQYNYVTKTYKHKYAQANPWNPTQAQEEAYSETVASLILYLANKVPTEKLYYDQGRTVSAVSHSDRPGYTAKAESTYPSKYEYDKLFRWLTGHSAPIK